MIFTVQDERTGDTWTVAFSNGHALELHAEVYQNGVFRFSYRSGYGHGNGIKAVQIIRHITKTHKQ